MLTLASIFSLNVFAEDIDYNTVVGINENGENHFYSLEGANGNAKWQDYINYYNSLHSDSPFGVINNLVTYKGYFLRNKSNVLVYVNDNVIVASGCVYKLEPIFVVDGNNLQFSELIGNKITFADLLENIKQTLFTVDYSAARPFVYYNSRPVLMNGGHVDTLLFIDTDIIYTLGAVCYHDWRIERNIEFPTCMKTGIAEVKCIFCKTIKIIDVPIDTENGHFWLSTSYAGPTCVKSGIEILTCKYCSKTFQEVLKPLGHKHTSPTCTEDAQCIRCGAIVETALGHNLKHGSWGKCLRNGCNFLFYDVQGALNSVGQNIVNGWNGTAVPILQNAGQAIGNGLKNGAEKVEEASTNVYEFFFPGEDGKGFGANIGITGDGKDDGFTKKLLNLGIGILVTILAIPIIIVIYGFAFFVAKIIKLIETKKQKKGNKNE